MKRSLIATLLALVLVLPTTATAQTDDPTDIGPRGGDVTVVKMKDGAQNRFRPRSVTIPEGTKIRWVNRGNLDHTTTSTTGVWDRRLDPGERFTRRFNNPGTFPYRCTIHPEMTGTIVVT